MRKHILNDISKKVLLIVILILTLTVIYQNYTDDVPTVTITELIFDYKGCIIVSKKNFKRSNVFYLKLRNPYINKDTDVRVPSGVYFNFHMGDTIGKKKQVLNLN